MSFHRKKDLHGTTSRWGMCWRLGLFYVWHVSQMPTDVIRKLPICYDLSSHARQKCAGAIRVCRESTTGASAATDARIQHRRLPRLVQGQALHSAGSAPCMRPPGTWSGCTWSEPSSTRRSSLANGIADSMWGDHPYQCGWDCMLWQANRFMNSSEASYTHGCEHIDYHDAGWIIFNRLTHAHSARSEWVMGDECLLDPGSLNDFLNSWARRLMNHVFSVKKQKVCLHLPGLHHATAQQSHATTSLCKALCAEHLLITSRLATHMHTLLQQYRSDAQSIGTQMTLGSLHRREPEVCHPAPHKLARLI